MDALGDLLRGVRADGALFNRTVLSGPWESEHSEGAALTLATVVRGTARVTVVPGTPCALREGDAAVVCTTAPFALSAAGSDECELVTGAYQLDSAVGRRLISMLPPLLIVPAGDDCMPILELIAAEVAADRPGRQYVMDRMLDWMLACTLREWFDLPDACPPAWYRALGDEVVGPALHAMHDEPSRPWTVASLAARAQVSRAAFARNFAELVGRPPMAYLTEWRMTLAAELLAEPGATVAAVAGQVGYADGFSFSDAFKRIRGIAPSGYRASLTAGRPDSGSGSGSLRAAG
ncbi:AraC family transcriptional regulator [Streptomyces durmitorensis]|uniref:AraC family transcriptional regulator n=1 Tax=Streptomyces durmitorensis TaxID=319947 RepID=A0ABY4PT80_9ACTN|nr:AraC family transcriptional regulator [Streptomyces durmitorensis]UQT56956.1 AraC family transcriptional regulator [Streptomyces durmitorensis]